VAAAGILDARTKKGDKAYKQALVAAAHMDWDQAVDLYQQAVDEDPRDTSYLIGMRRARFEAGQMHVDRARKLRADGKVEEALGEFQRAIIIDPSSSIALQELKRTQGMMNQPAGRADLRGLTPAEQLRKEDEDKFSLMQGPPSLKPTMNRIPMIKINNQPPRRLYETVGKIAGINVVMDPTATAIPNRNFDVDLSDSTVEQAFDYLALLTRTYWKPISSNTVFVTEESTNKRRDYEDWVVQTFYLTNATTAQEFVEISTAVRSIANLRQVFQYNAQKAMVVRGSVDAVALAGKLIRDLDKPKSEVVVDVYIMESNSARTRDLAATLASAGTAGINLSTLFTPRGSTTNPPANGGGGTVTPVVNNPVIALSRLGSLSSADFSTNLPGLIVQAMLSDNRTKLLNSPQVRASDGQKVTLKIGDQVPIATGTFQSAVGTVGGLPSANTQFQFKDVGISVDITPTVHSAEELTMHVEIEVSSVKSYQDVGGVKQPLIGTRRNVTDIRLREGEISVLGGLEGTQDSSVQNGIPGLMSVPGIGKFLFGSEHIEKDRQDLIILLAPHIVRTPDYTRENLRGVLSGVDQTVKVSYGAPADTAAPAPTTPNPGAAAVPPAATTPQAAAAPPTPGVARVSFLPGSISASPNGPFTVNVQLEGANDALAVSPLRVKWDPAVLRLNDIAPGDFLSRDNGRLTSVKDIRNDAGEATLTLSRAPGSSGVSGTGAVASLNFVAIGRGSATITVTELGLKNSQDQPVSVTLGGLPVAVQ